MCDEAGLRYRLAFSDRQCAIEPWATYRGRSGYELFTRHAKHRIDGMTTRIDIAARSHGHFDLGARISSGEVPYRRENS